ncbi:MAG: YihA family ribosome biogenesis GTP-binding protein [Erysipelotrichaceae bacterium]|nr:YihA family ribosome biogenesis GTP-binding protein [Erysipelotrichaceae bacterium]
MISNTFRSKRSIRSFKRPLSRVKFIKSANSLDNFPSTVREVVFVGRSNVGKSSLINALYNQKLAYIGKTPGKTKLINFFDVDEKYTAVDVPGYGYAQRSQKQLIDFAKMMDDYFNRKDKIRLVIMIVDSRIGLTKDDLDMFEYIADKGFRYLIVANKIDKLSNNQLNNNKKKLFSDYKNVVYVSAEKKKNIDVIHEKIAESL